MSMMKRLHVFLLSGKRYAGKDTVANFMKRSFESRGRRCELLSIADSCKIDFAKLNGLDADKMINDREYKELHRNDLTDYYRSVIEHDRLAYEKLVVDRINRLNVDEHDYVVVRDVRLLSGMNCLLNGLNDHHVTRVRIECSDENREKRGWKKTDYDYSFAETGLDLYDKWDYIIHTSDAPVSTLGRYIDELMSRVDDAHGIIN